MDRQQIGTYYKVQFLENVQPVFFSGLKSWSVQHTTQKWIKIMITSSVPREDFDKDLSVDYYNVLHVCVHDAIV